MMLISLKDGFITADLETVMVNRKFSAARSICAAKFYSFLCSICIKCGKFAPQARDQEVLKDYFERKNK